MNRRIPLMLPALILAAIELPFARAQDVDGSAAAEPAGPALAHTATIIFFRDKKFAGAAISYKVRENGVELCNLQNGTYCRIDAPAGRHEYVVHTEAKDVLSLEVQAGETRYVMSGISAGVFAGHPNLAPSDKATFDAMLPRLKDNTGQDLEKN